MGTFASKILPEDDSSTDTPLYVGSIEFLVDREKFHELGIRTLVSCVPDATPELTSFVTANSLHHVIYALDDSAEHNTTLFNAKPGVNAVAKFIHDERVAGRSVLVHCDAGVCRSPACVVAYLLLYGTKLYEHTSITFEQARQIVSRARPSMELRNYHHDLDELVRRIHAATN